METKGRDWHSEIIAALCLLLWFVGIVTIPYGVAAGYEAITGSTASDGLVDNIAAALILVGPFVWVALLVKYSTEK